MPLSTRIRRLRRTLCAVILSLGAPIGALGQSLDLKLDGTLEAMCEDKKIQAEMCPGARFIPSPEGQGVEPGGEGPAVRVRVPDGLWQPAGTLAFRFCPSRTIRMAPDPKETPLKTTLVESPVLHVEILEGKQNPYLIATVPAAGNYKPKGRLDLSHLKGGRWYHMAFAWDAGNGKLECYLNGVLQEQMRLSDSSRPWEPVANPAGELGLGGALGTGNAAAKIAIDSVQIFSDFTDENAVAATLKGRNVEHLEGEGRTVYTAPLDLSPYKLDLICEADFTKPLDVIAEEDLFEGEKRVRLPVGREWVFEGPGRAWTEGGRLHIENHKGDAKGHVVLWNTRVFPADFLLEFGVSPVNSKNGLNIVFFGAKAKTGGGIFDPGLPRRAGDFRTYHSDALNCYHISYWACAEGDGGTPRRTTNLRKNCGFYLPTCGNDRIAGEGPGPHTVRLLKVGGRIRLEARGVLSLSFDDDGVTYGPVWGEGCIGLRQMAHTDEASYTHFKVWKVEPAH